MSFQISALKLAQFAHLIGRSEEELAAYNARRVVADRHPGFPCRVSLLDAQPGETLLLLNYEHLAVDSPYQSRYGDLRARERARCRARRQRDPAALV